MTRLLRRCLALLSIVLLTGVLGGAAVAKQDVKVELFYSGVWNDHSTDVYTRDSISITHGAGNEQTGLVPSEASLTFADPTGKMNPANIRSPLHGLIGRNTPIRITVGTDVRFSGEVVSWKPRRAVKGDAWVHVVAGGTIRRLGQGEPPVESALTRWVMTTAPVAYWRLASGSLAEFDLPSAGDHPFDIAVAGPVGSTNIASAELAPWLEHGIQLVDVQARGGNVNMATAPAQWAIDHVRTLERITKWDPDLYMRGNSAGPIDWQLSSAIAGEIDIFITVAGVSTLLATVDVSADPDGLHHFRFAVAQDGADIDWTFYIDGELRSSGTRATTTLEGLSRVFVSGNPNTNVLGHLAIWTTPPAIADAADAAFGYPNEKAGDRFTRLCAEEGITSTIVGTAAETQSMGPQFPDTTLGLLREIQATDNGFIFDTRSQLGLTLRTGRSLYNQ